MFKRKQIVKNDSDMDYVDDFISIEEHSSGDDVTNELSLAEQVFTRLQIYSEGFKPSFFIHKDLANLSLTSKTLNGVVCSELNQRAAQKLLTHVVKGEQDKAQAMLEKNPGLLLIKSKAVDYSGRTIVGTAFQGAIGAGDKPMWKMMLSYFEGLEQGEALRQFDEQFPSGTEETPAAELKAYYDAIASAIIHDEDHGLSVIEGFRKEITCQKEITQGKHFNLQHLIAAYQAYIDNFYAFGNWGNRDLFWQKVIGYVQRQMTAYDAQIYCSGVISVLYNESSFSRTFELSDDKNFFPLQIDSALGFDFACYSYYSARALDSGSHHVLPSPLNEYWIWIEKLCGEKTDALVGLRESLEQGVYYQLK
ncbi:TPA: hypothetical protein ACT9HO_002089 [Legionella pneumophila]|uniref:hypothetical protein n=1 Tax=Legionella pneumophila TaxID=446 RepID=UPI0007707E94|nr:hypothetical protein [Legionella pneumophila]MCZ4747674.1 hypothetical protein [Legionella pneumophila]CZH70768.1 Uncharacterised protein [Legionella pneumophila]CZH94049.1 Uncharacterised protein [Legionella pneumophila]